ncbi:MAG: copper amine oxidase N-terminal domain-containing protein [Oscillospiraceae bacterium]|nr:copper amine oxidase N-terminal domain-containing protein [Oscillospiraceae bacterium]
MKKLWRSVLCGGALAALLCTPALAAEEGDFSLVVNGEPVTFTDALPQLRSDRSFLPMAATFQALGYGEEDITWDNDARAVTAEKEGVTLLLTIGKNEIRVTGPEGEEVLNTDVAPYIDPASDRTYIPVGLVADALDYNVGWDGNTATVMIDDVDALLAANTATYEWMDRYMEYGRKYTQDACQVTGGYQMEFTAKDAVEEGRFTWKGDYTMLQSQKALQFDTDMEFHTSASSQGDASLDMNASMDVDAAMRMDLETGKLYFQSNALSGMLGAEKPDSWYLLDLKNTMDGLYGSGYYQELLALAYQQNDGGFGEVLAMLLREVTPVSPDMTTKDMLQLYNQLFSDQAFQKSGSSYVSSFQWEGMDVTFTLFTNGGSQVNGYAMEMSASAPGGLSMTMTASMKNDKMEMNMEIHDTMMEMDMTMTMDGVYRRSGTKPAGAPPAGAEVVDVMDLMLSMMEGSSI